VSIEILEQQRNYHHLQRDQAAALIGYTA